jgi:transcriptional regulator with XRE-family HTH domain
MRAENRAKNFNDDLFLRVRDYVRWTIGLCISRELRKNGVDYNQLAKLMNRSPALMYKFLGGRNNMTIDTIAEIAYVGKIPIKDAFGFYRIEKSFEYWKEVDRSMGLPRTRNIGFFIENPLLEGPPEEYQYKSYLNFPSLDF